MNAENRYRGQGDYPLDRQGYFDAVNAGVRLVGKRVAAIHCGPLQRTRDTAYVIGQITGVSGESHKVEKGLINLDYGDWEGLTPKECLERDPDLYTRYRTDPAVAYCPSGEKLLDAGDRFIDALQDLWVLYGGQGVAVAVVTHGVMIRLALARLIGPERWQQKSVGTGGIAVLEGGNGRWKLAGVDDELPTRIISLVDPVPVGVRVSGV